MPADISLVIGPNPIQFLFDSNLLPLSCHSSSNDVMGLPSLNHDPRSALTSLKSCLRNTHEHSDALRVLEPSGSPLKIEDNAEVTFTRGNTSPKKEKRVTFADTQGVPLISVKYVVESCYEPPRSLSSSDLLIGSMNDLILPGENPTNLNPRTKLCLQFSQPAADFVAFKQRLDGGHVALENVIIKNSNCISGTVKVKNIAFHKKVSIRITFDDWATYNDIVCDFVNNAYEGGIYNTFQFSINVPDSFYDDPNLIQFCVCYECNSQNFWDNNYGKNYSIAPIYFGSAQPIPKNARMKSPKLLYPSTYAELPKPEERSWLCNGNTLPYY